MRFLRDTLQMLLWRGVSIALGAVTAVFIARWLGPEDRGLFALMILWIGFAALILQFGIPEASIYLLGGKLFPEQQILSTVLAYFCGAALLGALGCVAVCLALGIQLFAALLLAASLAVMVMVAALRHFLLAHREFRRYSLSVVVEAALNLAVLAILQSRGSLTVTGALGAYFLAQAGTFVLLASWLPRGDAAPAPRHVRGAVLWRGVRQGVHLFATGLGGFGVQRIGYLLLEWFTGTRAVGLFAAASALPVLFANLPQQLGTVLYSHVSASEAGEGGRLAAAVFQLLAVLGLLMLLPLYLLRNSIAVLLFGSEFSSIADPMVVLSAGMLMTGLGGVLFNALAGTGAAHYGGWLTAGTLAVMSILGCMLIPEHGLLGAAIAQCVTAALSLLVVATLFCRWLDLPARTLLVPAADHWRALWARRGRSR